MCPFSVAAFFGRCLAMKRVFSPGHSARWIRLMARIVVDGDELKHDVERYCANLSAV